MLMLLNSNSDSDDSLFKNLQNNEKLKNPLNYLNTILKPHLELLRCIGNEVKK